MACPDFEVLQSITLQCARCGESETTRLDSRSLADLDDCGNTQLYCASCKSLTDFIRTRASDIPAELNPDVLITADEIFAHRPADHPAPNHRELRIFPKHMKACIREDNTNDIADVQNYSRMGTHISTTRTYKLGTEIELALDYSVGGVNIFQKARVIGIYRHPKGAFSGEYEIAFLV